MWPHSPVGLHIVVARAKHLHLFVNEDWTAQRPWTCGMSAPDVIFSSPVFAKRSDFLLSASRRLMNKQRTGDELLVFSSIIHDLVVHYWSALRTSRRTAAQRAGVSAVPKALVHMTAGSLLRTVTHCDKLKTKQIFKNTTANQPIPFKDTNGHFCCCSCCC